MESCYSKLKEVLKTELLNFEVSKTPVKLPGKLMKSLPIQYVFEVYLKAIMLVNEPNELATIQEKLV